MLQLSTVVASTAANHCRAATRALAACSWHAVGLQRLVHQASDQNQHAAAQGADTSEQHRTTHAHHQQQLNNSTQATCNWQLLPHISRAVLPALGPSHSSSSRGFASTSASAEAGDKGDIPRRRRRSTTESRAAMRRTTVRAIHQPAVHDASSVACTRNA